MWNIGNKLCTLGALLMIALNWAGTVKGEAVVYQAEKAILSDCSIRFKHKGYSGRGYVDFNDGKGGSVEWRVEAPHTGECT